MLYLLDMISVEGEYDDLIIKKRKSYFTIQNLIVFVRFFTIIANAMIEIAKIPMKRLLKGIKLSSFSSGV